MPWSFESEVISWPMPMPMPMRMAMAENGHSQMFGASEQHPCSMGIHPMRNTQSSTATIYDYADSLTNAATGVDPDNVASCSQIADAAAAPWHHPYSSADHLLSALLPPSSFPNVKEMGATDTSALASNMQTGEPSQPHCPTLQSSQEGSSSYESKNIPQ